MKQKDREALIEWDKYRENVLKSTPVDLNESHADKEKRIKYLLSNEEEFAKYYLPVYMQSETAEFQKRFLKRILKDIRSYITRPFARSHAKSVIAGIRAPLFLKFNSKLKNMLLVSYSNANAKQLLKPLQIQLESNQRLINDFGIQKGYGTWEEGNFITKDGCSFRAIGTGESPRGTRNEAARPDYILCDDIDEDELCRNPKRLDNAWDWMQGPLFGCFDITGIVRFVVVGNIIAADCLVKRAINVSDDNEQIDILCKGTDVGATLVVARKLQKQLATANEKQAQVINDAIGYCKQGLVPSWSERFTIMDCAYMINKMGYRNSQREYFNNPITEGKVFKKDWMQFKKLPPLSAYHFLVNYLDPGFKKTATSDSKAMILIGLMNGEFHIRKVFCGQASIEEMVDWGYEMDDYVKAKNGSYIFKMEEVFLQSLLYKDFNAAAIKRKRPLPVSGDTRKKPDKDARIEATSGYFERGAVYFDEAIKEDHHVKELIAQYLAFQPGVKTKKDGPDCAEGGFHILTQMVGSHTAIELGNRYENNKRA